MNEINSIKTASHPSSNTGELKKLKQVTKQFEQIFVKMMLKEMNKNLGQTGFLDGGPYEKMFKDMLTDQRAEQMAQSGELGLARQMFEQLKSQVEKHPDATPSQIEQNLKELEIEQAIHNYRRPKSK